MYTFYLFSYIWLMKRYRISLSRTCFMKEINMSYLDPMFMFNKCGEVCDKSSDIERNTIKMFT